MSWQLKSDVAKEGVDSRQPQVTAADAQSPLLLKVIEKRNDQRRVDLFKVELGGRLVQPLLSKLQEHPECIAI